jgi:DMSO reductase anchor subunit
VHPALSVILFTTLSGAGYGLLIWTALAALYARPGDAGGLLACALTGLVLATVGLLSSMLHLGKPARAWRAFSQWRTSWLSREGVMAVVTYIPALLLGGAAWLEWLDPESLVFRASEPTVAVLVIALATIGCALATIVCTAMIYASLKPIPAWRHRLVVPVYLVFALLSGLALLAAILSAAAALPAMRIVATALALLAALAAGLKLGYWHALDRIQLPADRGDAVGLPGRAVSVFERPHTEASYITREMAFVVARRHARRLRALALLLFTGVPLLAVYLTMHAGVEASWCWSAAAIAILAGGFVERWLFFAQARHMVTLYY